MALFNGPNDVIQEIYETLRKTASVDEFIELVYQYTKNIDVLPEFLVEASKFYTNVHHWKKLPSIYAKRLLETC